MGWDVSHIYGQDIERQNKLRAFKDGKLKSQVRLDNCMSAEDCHILPQMFLRIDATNFVFFCKIPNAPHAEHYVHEFWTVH